MLCHEYRDLMFERLSGELSPAEDASCSQHEQSCAICRAELASVRAMQAQLRAGWPSEDPLPMPAILPPRAARHWFDVGALWFSRASAGLVAACLLFLVLVRPSVQVGHGSVQLAFGAMPAAQAQPATPAVNEAQVKAMVQAAVNEQMAQVRNAAAPAAQASPDVTQVALQVREMRRTEATLWQAVQQHGLSLEALWRNSETPLRPASLVR